MEPGLIRLWMSAFGDSEEFVRGFADHMGEEDLPVVCRESGEPASALHLLSCGVRLHGALLPASYIYAAATLPQHRGQGMMSRLVRRSFRTARERGAAVALVLPASASLYGYYGGFGFTDVFRLAGTVLGREELKALAEAAEGSARTADTAPYELYEEWMTGFRAAVVRSRRMFSFGAAECAAAVLQVPGEPDGLCLFRPEGEQVLVRELLVRNGHVPLLAGELLRKYPDCRSYQLSLPMCRVPASLTGYPWTSRAYGMARLLNAGEALRAWAGSNPEVCLDISVTDPILKENAGSYRVEGGEALSIPGPARLRLNITTLTRLLLLGCDPDTDVRRCGYSRAEMETLFPVGRPYMNMMLD